MNFLAIVQRLHSETVRSTPAPTGVVGQSDRNTRIVNAVADAWMELQSERDWRWMRATTDAPLTPGLQTYAASDLGVSTRFGRWRKETDDYSALMYLPAQPNSLWELNFWDLDWFRQEYIYRTQGNTTPIGWSIDENDQFLVGPAPSLAYMLRAEYWKEPFALATDADEPDMPARFHMWLVWRALQDVAKADAAPELLAKAEKNAGDLHDKLLFDQARLPHL